MHASGSCFGVFLRANREHVIVLCPFLSYLDIFANGPVLYSLTFKRS